MTALPPLIGISTYREDAVWGVWHQTADLLHREYADAVVRAGGVPVLLPPACADLDFARAAVRCISGLIIAGGADVEPARYGQEPHAATASWRPDRDAWELALVTAAEESVLPTFGVCRGMQVMAVAAGGELDQHTPDVVGHEQHSPGAASFGMVEVTTVPDTLVARVLGPEVRSHCHHHQSVRSHPGYRATAWAADGTVEAMEVEAPDRFCLAVQWHPEMARDQRLFDALVVAARSRRRG